MTKLKIDELHEIEKPTASYRTGSGLFTVFTLNELLVFMLSNPHSYRKNIWEGVLAHVLR